jgi:aspartyl-tRNA(Asn)/glutamyl-tRNA(Gln) amidotransferase subunit B
MEIVSRPDLRSSEEAGAYLRKAPRDRALPRGLRRQHGGRVASLRCQRVDPPARATELGTKVEIKNLNSFRNVGRPLEYEVRRQTRALDAGERIVQETRLWDPTARTVSMRSKEFAHDYRYFPEPDLPPLDVSRRVVEESAAPARLARARRDRFERLRALLLRSRLLTQARLADYFEAARGRPPTQGRRPTGC